MLRIYICPQCYNFRMVSRKPDAICFHCGSGLVKSDIEYTQYMEMSEKERDLYKEKFIERMKLYHTKVEAIHKDQSK